MTSHYPCYILLDTRKYLCVKISDGKCTFCPGKCGWNLHYNNTWRWVIVDEIENREIEELKEKDGKASANKFNSRKMIKKCSETISRYL
jgi:hypothetical protein